MNKTTFFVTHNNAIDEWWPSTAEALPKCLMLGWSWCGTNVIGLFWNGRCLFGMEFRLGDEPSIGVIVSNAEYGVWWPHDE